MPIISQTHILYLKEYLPLTQRPLQKSILLDLKTKMMNVAILHFNTKNSTCTLPHIIQTSWSPHICKCLHVSTQFFLESHEENLTRSEVNANLRTWANSRIITLVAALLLQVCNGYFTIPHIFVKRLIHHTAKTKQVLNMPPSTLKLAMTLATDIKNWTKDVAQLPHITWHSVGHWWLLNTEQHWNPTTGNQVSFMLSPFQKIPPMQFYLQRRIVESLFKTVAAFLNLQ